MVNSVINVVLLRQHQHILGMHSRIKNNISSTKIPIVVTNFQKSNKCSPRVHMILRFDDYQSGVRFSAIIVHPFIGNTYSHSGHNIPMFLFFDNQATQRYRLVVGIS